MDWSRRSRREREQPLTMSFRTIRVSSSGAHGTAASLLGTVAPHCAFVITNWLLDSRRR